MNLPSQQLKKNKPKIAIVVTTPLIVRFFLYKHIEKMTINYSVVVLTTVEKAELLDILPQDVQFLPVPIKRNINLIADIRTLFQLIQIFHKEKFDLVHSVTPKAGLLAMLAAKLVSVPNRVHTFTGQVWVTRKGVKRILLKLLDKVIVFCATTVLIDSHSQREFLLKENVVTSGNSKVLADGSISGVDLSRFHVDLDRRNIIRTTLKLDEKAILILFVGRITYDKGVLELAKAFVLLHEKYPEAKLLYVGPDEEKLLPILENVLNSYISSVQFIPYTTEPEHYMQAADIFCLPSYREGFGSVIIEAAACGVPAVASRIYGLTDAIEENTTGLLVEPGNDLELANVLERVVADRDLRNSLAEAAHRRAILRFSQERLTKELLNLYSDLINHD